MRFRPAGMLTSLALIALVTGCPQPKDDPTLQFDPAPVRMQRLLARQYVNSVRYLVGDAAAAVATPPEDVVESGYTAIGSATIAMVDSALNQYEDSARAVAKVGAADNAFRARWITCSPSGPTDASCHESFVRDFGFVAWRRPLSDEEVARWVDVAVTAATDYDDFYKGTEYALSGMLQSPNFLYRIELGEPMGDGRREIAGYELASKLSFFLTDTTPSEQLLKSAASGGLDTSDGIRSAAIDLMEQDAAKAAVSAFWAERSKTDRLTSVPKDNNTFPDWSPAVGVAAQTESRLLLEHVVFEEGLDVREIFTADYAFVNRDLAQIYGISPAPGANEFVQRDLPAQHERRGIFGEVAFLALNAHPKSTSPTRRGLFVQDRILCTVIPPPPPNVNPELPEPDPGNPMTMRERLEAHMQDDACSSCHLLMDTIGFGLENYDGIGRYRTYDEGFPIDPSGEVVGLGTFEKAKGLSELLADDPAVTNCLMRNFFRHSIAHLETPGEEPVIEYLDDRLYESGYHLKETLIELVASDAFRIVGEPE